MSKFKVGDRVRYIGAKPSFDKSMIGKTGTVTKDDGGVCVGVDWDGSPVWSYGVYRENIELASRFKAGDKVRAVGFTALLELGKEYVVTKANDDDVWVDVKTDTQTHNLSYPHEYFVALAPATGLQIQAGRYYKTRDGRKVGPMVKAGAVYRSEFEFTVDDWFDARYGKAWRADGTFHPDVGEKDDADLIAEWTDEPVARAFPVNSRVVRANGYKPDVYGTVTGHISDEYNTVKWDDNGGNSNTWQDCELKLAAPTTIADIVARHSQTGTAIVAVLENGQPRPATRPYVHTTASAAETEANRLARTNPGKEFGVYTLGAVAKVEKTYEHEWQRLAAKRETLEARNLLQKTGLTALQASRVVQEFAAAA